MEDDESLPISTTRPCYTAMFRPDPANTPVSDKDSTTLQKLANHLGQLEGFQELGRDDRPYQVVVYLGRTG